MEEGLEMGYVCSIHSNPPLSPSCRFQKIRFESRDDGDDQDDDLTPSLPRHCNTRYPYKHYIVRTPTRGIQTRYFAVYCIAYHPSERLSNCSVRYTAFAVFFSQEDPKTTRSHGHREHTYPAHPSTHIHARIHTHLHTQTPSREESSWIPNRRPFRIPFEA